MVSDDCIALERLFPQTRAADRAERGRVEPTAHEADTPARVGPTNVLPRGFGAGRPPASASGAAAVRVRDLAEPLSFNDPPPERRERGLWQG
jgi:hypothetical protein